MVAIVISEEIQGILDSSSIKPSVSKSDTVHTVTHTSLLSVLRSNPDAPSLYQLLQSTTIHLSHTSACEKLLPPPPPNPALQKRLEKLRNRLDEMEYARITRDISRTSSSQAEVEEIRMGKIMPQMAVGVNVIVSMATGFVAGYFVCWASFKRENIALMGGLAGLVLVMLVEICLFSIRMWGIGKGVEKEKKRKDKKT